VVNGPHIEKLAEDAIDRVLADNANLAKQDPEQTINTSAIRQSCSIEVQLIGSAGWSLQMPDTLKRQGMPDDVAEHLSHNYGDRAAVLAKIANDEGLGLNKLAVGYPFIEAEVVYACRHEYAYTAVDVIAQRMRLAFLNSDSALQALPRVIQLMAQEHNWDTSRRVQEYQRAVTFINTMNRKGRTVGLDAGKASLRQAERRIQQVFQGAFPTEQIDKLRDEFKQLDTDNDDILTRAQVQKLIETTDLFGSSVQQALNSGAETPKVVKVFLSHLDLHAFTADDTTPKDSVTWEELLLSYGAAVDAQTRQQQRS